MKSLSQRTINLAKRIFAPNRKTRLFNFVERTAQQYQGKGCGGFSILQEVDALSGFIPSNIEIVFDVGGNKGLWTQAFLQRSPKTKKIYVFEPAKENIAEIEKTRDPRVEILQNAVGSSSREAILYSDTPGSGLASLTKRRLDHFDIDMHHEETVSVVTLDEFIQKNHQRAALPS